MRHDSVAVDLQGKIPWRLKFFWRQHPDEAFRKVIKSIKVSGGVANIVITRVLISRVVSFQTQTCTDRQEKEQWM